ncbi:hypothetical protein DFJ73DRAFT_18426 [Zopfochytrium polystomum]|nr:hypothetical protein DFJ73DRAFT_18426 [Zopfochytrium polystomum]
MSYAGGGGGGGPPSSKRHSPAAPLTPVVKQYGHFPLHHQHHHHHHQQQDHQIAALMSSKNPFPPIFPSLPPTPPPAQQRPSFSAVFRSRWCRMIVTLALLGQIALALFWISSIGSLSFSEKYLHPTSQDAVQQEEVPVSTRTIIEVEPAIAIAAADESLPPLVSPRPVPVQEVPQAADVAPAADSPTAAVADPSGSANESTPTEAAKLPATENATTTASHLFWPAVSPLPLSEFNFSYPPPPIRPVKGLRMSNLPETSPHFGYMLQDGPLMLKRTFDRPPAVHNIAFDTSLRGEFLHLAAYADDVAAGVDEGVPYCPTMPDCNFYFSNEFDRMAEEADALVTDKTSGILVHNASLHFTKVGIVPYPHKQLEEYEWFGTDAHASHLPMLSRHQAYSRPIHIPLYSIAESQLDFTLAVNFSSKLPVVLFVIPPESSCDIDPARREAMVDLARQLRRESAMPVKFIVPNQLPTKVRRGGESYVEFLDDSSAEELKMESVEAFRGIGRENIVESADWVRPPPQPRDPVLGTCDILTPILADRPHEQPVREVPNLKKLGKHSSHYSRRLLMTALAELDTLCPSPKPASDPSKATPWSRYDPVEYDRYTRCLLTHSIALVVIEPVPEPRLISDWVWKAQVLGTQTFHFGAKSFENNEFELSEFFPGGSALSMEHNLFRHRKSSGDTLLRHISDIIKNGPDYVRNRFMLKTSYQDADRAPQFPSQLMTYMATGGKLSFPCRLCAHVKIKKSNVQCMLNVVKHVVDKGVERRKRLENERVQRDNVVARQDASQQAVKPLDKRSSSAIVEVGSPSTSLKPEVVSGALNAAQLPAGTAPIVRRQGEAQYPWVPPSKLANESWGPVSTAEFLHPSERVYGMAPEFAGVLDRIYVMHYSRSPIRRSHVAKVLRGIGSEGQLVMDMDREDLTHAAERCMDWSLSPATAMDPLRVYKNGEHKPKQLKSGEISLNYKNVISWYLMLLHNENFAMLVEDDAALELGVDARSFSDTLRFLPPNYSIVHVGTCSGSVKGKLGQERKVEVTLGSRCTGAYTISKQGVIMLFKNFPLRVAIDLQMIDVTFWHKQHFGITRHPDYRNFFVTPALLRPSETMNDIGSTGIRADFGG